MNSQENKSGQVVTLVMTIPSLEETSTLYSSKWSLYDSDSNHIQTFDTPKDARIWALQNGYIISDSEKEYISTKRTRSCTPLFPVERHSNSSILIVKKDI